MSDKYHIQCSRSLRLLGFLRGSLGYIWLDTNKLGIKFVTGKSVTQITRSTKVMQCWVSRFQSEDSGEHPCGVCRKGVGDNSILCVKCLKWVHKRCSGISGKLKSNVDFHCRRCMEGENGLFQSVFVERGCD